MGIHHSSLQNLLCSRLEVALVYEYKHKLLEVSQLRRTTVISLLLLRAYDLPSCEFLNSLELNSQNMK